MNYTEYLNSENWKGKRALKLEQSPKCEGCLESDNLQVHHLNYGNWHDVRMSDLMTLCRSCHYILHALVTSSEIKDYMETKSSQERAEIARTELKKLLLGKIHPSPIVIGNVVDPITDWRRRKKKEKRQKKNAERIEEYIIIDG